MSQTQTPERPAAAAEEYPTHPVGDLQQVLAAIADPVRLEMVRRLASLEAVPCGRLYDAISKSTASHHFKILREAGVTQRVVRGAQTCQQLRLDEVEARHPRVLTAVLAAAGASSGAGPAHRHSSQRTSRLISTE